MNKYQRNFWLDLILLVIFLITLATAILLWQKIPGGKISLFAGVYQVDGRLIHIIPGLAGLAGVIIHIIWHWDWLRTLRGRPLMSLKKPVRANRVTNRLTWFSYLTSNFFGILAWLLSASLPAGALKISVTIHAAAGLICIFFLAAHLTLHQKWIVSKLPVHLKFCQRGV